VDLLWVHSVMIYSTRVTSTRLVPWLHVNGWNIIGKSLDFKMNWQCSMDEYMFVQHRFHHSTTYVH